MATPDCVNDEVFVPSFWRKELKLSSSCDNGRSGPQRHENGGRYDTSDTGRKKAPPYALECALSSPTGLPDLTVRTSTALK